MSKKAIAATQQQGPYYEAEALCKQVQALKFKMQLNVVLVSYARDVMKVKVEFLELGAPSLVIEYWGNAELWWVKSNIEANIKSIKEGERA